MERANTLDRAKEAVAKCSVSDLEKVEAQKLGKTQLTVGEVLEAALTLERDYCFFRYNCRHFVLDLLKLIV